MYTLRNYWHHYQAWHSLYVGKELKDMPWAYLVVQFFIAIFISTMLPTMLLPATTLYFEAWDKPVPWWWAGLGLWLLALWTIQIGALLAGIFHGQALSEKMSAPAKKVERLRFPPRQRRRRL